MFKRSFGRIIAVATLVFALFIAVSIIQVERQIIEDERIQKAAPANEGTENGFRLETLVGSILTGI